MFRCNYVNLTTINNRSFILIYLYICTCNCVPSRVAKRLRGDLLGSLTADRLDLRSWQPFSSTSAVDREPEECLTGENDNKFQVPLKYYVHMAGRRLLDAAKLFNASRSIAKQHIALRSQQWEVYTQTSSLAKAVKSQTDRITVTARAAYALTRRFNEDRPSYTTGSSSESQTQNAAYSQYYNEPIPRRETQGSEGVEGEKEGLQQDHHYGRPEGNATTESPAGNDLDVKQEKARRDPLPDGTIPPGEPIPSEKSTAGHSHEHSPNELRRLQRQAESQIPSSSADSQEASSWGAPSPGQDSFSTRSEATTPDLSSLPRTKIPKHAEDAQGSDEHLQDGQINADVYYSSKGRNPTQQIPSNEAVPEQEGVSGNINTDVFHSPRISSLLGGRDDARKAYEMKMRAARRTPIDRTPLAEGTDQETFSVRQTDDTPAAASGSESSISPLSAEPTQTSEAETLKFAESLAKDAQSAAAVAAEVRQDTASSWVVLLIC